MILLLALSISYIAIPLAAAEDFNPLGSGVYLPEFSLVGNSPKDFKPKILNPLAPQKCIMEVKDDGSAKRFNYYKNTRAFYTSVATASGLENSLKTDFSLGYTLAIASKGFADENLSVTGNSLLIEASYGQDMLDKTCLMFEENFHKEFLESLKNLPSTIREPWNSNAWKAYDVFLKAYGSHAVTSTLLGSSINQMVFAETVDAYKERDFKVKSCLSLAGKTDISELGVSVCSGIDKSEISQVSKMAMIDYLDIRGGSTETRNELIKHRTADLIEKFMNEAKASKSAIQYKLTPLWEILQALYAKPEADTENFLRAVNLEYYYLGYLNYGCHYESDGEQDLQKFDFTKYSSPKAPQYECSLAPEGCHSDEDCQRRAVAWCSCKGPSCVRYRDVKLVYTCEEKKKAEINMEADWEWHGCELSFFKGNCYCRSPSKRRTTVWKIENKNAFFQAHFVSLNRNISKGKDEL